MLQDIRRMRLNNQQLGNVLGATETANHETTISSKRSGTRHILLDDLGGKLCYMVMIVKRAKILLQPLHFS